MSRGLVLLSGNNIGSHQEVHRSEYSYFTGVNSTNFLRTILLLRKSFKAAQYYMQQVPPLWEVQSRLSKSFGPPCSLGTSHDI